MRGKPLTKRINVFKLIVNIKIKERKEKNVTDNIRHGRDCILCLCDYLCIERVERMSIGENIKRLREEKGILQSELAEILNISQSMVCQLERGTKVPTLPLSNEIAKVLDCSLDELIQ